MYFKILGPLEVEDGGRQVEIGGPKQRALLTILLLRANETVSRDVLIEELWGERPPSGAAHGLEAHVSRLRKLLHGNGREVILTRPTGYLLRLNGDEVDLARFHWLTDAGLSALREGDYDGAAESFRRAFGLWRGRPLDDVAFESFAQVEISRLEERHAVAYEWLFEAELARGRHAEVVDELKALIRRYPLRERFQAQLMLALYRSGRQAEALDAYSGARRSLVEELGIEPGDELRELERKILRHDSSLELEAPRDEADSSPIAATSRPGRRALAVGTIAIAALAGVAATASLVVWAAGGSGHGIAEISANAVGVLETSRNKLSHEVGVGVNPRAVAAGDGAVWVTNADGHSVSRIDPRTNTIRQTIQVGDSPSGIAYGDRAVWVANTLSGTVSRIDPGTNQVVDRIPVGSGPSDLAFGKRALWVTNAGDGTISKIDSDNDKVLDTLHAGAGADAVAVGSGSVWIVSTASDALYRIDPKSDEVASSIPVGHGPTAVAAAAHSIWVANGLDGTIMRVDPRSNSVAEVTRVGDGPSGIALGAGAVWVTNEFSGTVTRIDATDAKRKRTTHVGNRPEELVVSNEKVYVAVRAGAGAHRGGTIRYLIPPGPGTEDLRLAVDPSMFNFFSGEAYDSLVGLRRVGGAAGAEMVPDLATAMPVVTDGGKTYTFELRRGIRYSNGTPVRPEDFRYGLERAFKLKSYFASLFGGIVGAPKCARQPGACDLSMGVVANDTSYRVVFHLLTPDPDFLDKLALTYAVPIPIGWPIDGSGRHVPPTTSATMLATATPRKLVFVRNPYFREWTKAARPNRYTDRETFAVAQSAQAAVEAVERGRADVADAFDLSTVPRSLLRGLHRQYGSQIQLNPLARTVYLALHTRVPPFNDVRVRRALNYAIDRRAVVRLWGGPDSAVPTCQVLPPNFPGYRRYCPYTLDPNSRGTWNRPDLAKAKRLVAASGTRGMSVLFWERGDAYPGGRRIAAYVASTLRSLGYRVRIRLIPVNAPADLGRHQRREVGLNMQDWFADYPAASNFVNNLLSCSSMRVPVSGFNLAEFCDRRIDAEIKRALSLDQTDPSAANALWANVDHDVVDQAPWVPLLNPQSFDFVSKRVGNYQYNPQWHGLGDQMWVR